MILNSLSLYSLYGSVTALGGRNLPFGFDRGSG